MHKLAVVLILVAACGSKKKDGGGDNSGGGGADKPVEAKLVWKKVGGMGIEAEVPEDAKIDDNTAGAGHPMATIWASPTTFVSGEGDSDLKPTLEEQKARLEKEPGNKFKKWLKEEKTADGWVLEVERESMTGDALTQVAVRRTINDKPFNCGSNVRGADEVAKVKKLCQSLRAAK
jgi:hypothetical protein